MSKLLRKIKRLFKKSQPETKAPVKRSEHVTAVCEATGWTRAEALEKMRAAKEVGMTFSKYAKNKCWEMDLDQIEALVKQQAAKKEELAKKKEKYITTVCEATGWSRARALAEMTKAKAAGMPYFRYVNNQCWKLDLDTIKKLNEEILERKKDKGAYAKKFTLKEICDTIGVAVPEEYKSFENEKFTNVGYSSKFARPDGALFIKKPSAEAVTAEISKAIEEKVKMVFVEKEYANHPLLKDVNHIIVDNSFAAVIKMCQKIRKEAGIRAVGVTGSVGKTTTKDMIYSVMRQGFVTRAGFGNENTIQPLFKNLQKMPCNAEFFIQEYGANMPGVMPRTVDACIPNASVVTCIAEPHLDNFKTKENIMAEKLKMAEKMEPGCPVFLNYDDELLKTVEMEDRPVIFFSLDNPEADYYAENIVDTEDGLEFDVCRKDKRNRVTLHIKGDYNIRNGLVAYAVGEWFGMPDKKIVEGIEKYRPIGMRQNITNIGGYDLFIDCYNTAPVSLIGAVKVMEGMTVEGGGKRVAIIGDIPRLGEHGRQINIDTGKTIAGHGLDLALCFGNEDAEAMAEAINSCGVEAHYTADRNELNQWVRDRVTKNDVTLIKGSVFRLLTKTIDQVWGTSLHVTSEHYELYNEGDFRVKLIWEKEHHDRQTAAIIGYSGTDEEPAIFANSRGIDIFSLAAGSFAENTYIEKITVPETVFNIGKGAFNACSNLKEVVLPASIKVIEPNAFLNCKNLKSINLEEGLIHIGETAFKNCTSLESITIPASVGRIEDEAFAGCRKLKIYCKQGSYAEEYLLDNGYKFEFI